MKILSKQKLIKNILKILKIKNEKDLIKTKRKNFDKWDSLIHLQIIFLIVALIQFLLIDQISLKFN